MSSSKNVKFSETELQALNPWTALQNFGVQRSENVAPNEPTRILTVEEIETMQQQAYDEAFAQGKLAGFEQGKLEGLAEGKQQGFAEGSKQGYEENLHLLQKQAADFTQLMETLNEPLQKLDAAIEDELVKLVIAIASQIIRREIKLDGGQIIAVIREALKVLPLASQKIVLNLHPEDAELVRNTLKLDESMPPWCLVENPLITRGGCTVETEISHIDATLENRLAAVVATVLGGQRQQDSAT